LFSNVRQSRKSSFSGSFFTSTRVWILHYILSPAGAECRVEPHP
jgi:hypothetical protein